MSQLEKCVAARKMCHSEKSVSQLEKFVTEKCEMISVSWVIVRKMCHSLKSVLELEKWVTVRKIKQKSMSQLEKWVTVRKACHSWNCVTVRKCVTV